MIGLNKFPIIDGSQLIMLGMGINESSWPSTASKVLNVLKEGDTLHMQKAKKNETYPIFARLRSQF